MKRPPDVLDGRRSLNCLERRGVSPPVTGNTLRLTGGLTVAPLSTLVD